MRLDVEYPALPFLVRNGPLVKMEEPDTQQQVLPQNSQGIIIPSALASSRLCARWPDARVPVALSSEVHDQLINSVVIAAER
jgi:hypothetical protein